ncbi:MAG: signal peptidase I [Epsilonproteobacteria bacterium]|jgi:signal peptidase I|nr:signal peptidase I [Campylobacterota bacterium]NPA88842.1 signal peptidase I [Campylobacterota bacterium]
MWEKLKKLYRWSNSWTGTIVIVLTIIFFLAQAFIIPSGSMKNTLLIGDALFAKKFSYGVPIPHLPWLEIPLLPDFRGDGHLIDGPRPQRGDIVIFRYPRNPRVHFVKRCVAVGGDRLMVRDKHLYLRVEDNDQKTREFARKMQAEIVEKEGKIWVKDPYAKLHPGIHHDPSITRQSIEGEDFLLPIFDYGPIVVPQDSYFMMGDNRDHSNDSRWWGIVRYRYIVGKPWFIYMSWDNNGVIRWHRIFRTIDSLEEELREGKKPYLTKGCYKNNHKKVVNPEELKREIESQGAGRR